MDEDFVFTFLAFPEDPVHEGGQGELDKYEEFGDETEESDVVAGGELVCEDSGGEPAWGEGRENAHANYNG